MEERGRVNLIDAEHCTKALQRFLLVEEQRLLMVCVEARTNLPF
jgi:hypothetical protein